ncbi:PREDICTED: uncharacterized protein LOC104806845 [Tarenaya hassleriana]|uniref:uncharacterized protein LOC104806845 n=1 Tax=Tarenaya hassleriana TaxID=28532 RepID=UPI00053C0BE0|nr:PREDICTED: uncharacterized protein LOC104806845 [Tarenaya hassleriana]
MNTTAAVTHLRHHLQQISGAEDLKIHLSAYVVPPDSSELPFSFECQFSPYEFVYEEDDSPGKEELYYFLTESGIEDFDAQFVIIDLVLLACEVLNSIDDGFRGVLALNLIVLFHPVEDNRPGSGPKSGLDLGGGAAKQEGVEDGGQKPGSDRRTGGEEKTEERVKRQGGEFTVSCT